MGDSVRQSVQSLAVLQVFTEAKKHCHYSVLSQYALRSLS